jgi:hypothetical protein
MPHELDAQDSEERRAVFSYLDSCKKRLADMRTDRNLRDMDALWEAYSDLESAIGLSKFVFYIPLKAGTFRRLTVSKEADPRVVPDKELERKYSIVESGIVTAQTLLTGNSVEEGIELLRKARDELKAMLLSARKNSKG